MTDDELLEGLIGLLRLGFVIAAIEDDEETPRFWPTARRTTLRERWDDVPVGAEHAGVGPGPRA